MTSSVKRGMVRKKFTLVIQGEMPPDTIKGPVVDTQFDVADITYVKPAPPMGEKSEFFRNGRPRNDSSGLTHCPPVGITYRRCPPKNGHSFVRALPNEPALYATHEEEWLAEMREASAVGTILKPFAPISVTFDGWAEWCRASSTTRDFRSIRFYARDLFETKVRTVIDSAFERLPTSILPSRYILAITEENGQDRANDLSHIVAIREMTNAQPIIREIARDVRVFHEYALAVACAYAVIESIENVLWEKEPKICMGIDSIAIGSSDRWHLFLPRM